MDINSSIHHKHFPAPNNFSDPEIKILLHKEGLRQQEQINLIASENYVSHAIREATASLLTNKYAEGYPGKRYYAGCEIVDEIEEIARRRCRELFNADHANVQPHSGSSANFAVYQALLKPGDTILGMSLASGGHLTHGHAVNLSGTYYHSVSYGVNRETELLDFDEIAKLADIHKPKLIIAGASAYSRIIDFETFAKIAKAIGAYLIADIAHIAGLVATGDHPSPVSHAHVVTSTTHKTLRGPRGGIILSQSAHKEQIDRAIMPGTQGGPLLHVIAAKATCFHEATAPEFKIYQQQVLQNARIMAQAFIDRGYRIVAGGTDNHLFIVDLSTTTHTGASATKLLESIGIIVSKSCIPFDTRSPWITSGIRIGTPAMTTRGMSKNTALEIVDIIDKAFKSTPEQLHLLAIRVKQIALNLPLPK